MIKESEIIKKAKLVQDITAKLKLIESCEAKKIPIPNEIEPLIFSALRREKLQLKLERSKILRSLVKAPQDA